MGGDLGDTWYISRSNQKFGPINWSDLQEMSSRGEIAPTDSVWTEGLSTWSPAASISGLVNGGTSYKPVCLFHGGDAPASDYASFWQRVGAYLLDSVVSVLIEVVIARVMGVPLVPVKGTPPSLSYQLLVFGALWIYFAGMESSALQATLGKMALGLKVTDLEGNPIGFGRATGRYLGKIISALILCIGYLMVAFTAKRQALHDMMAGCLVTTKK